MSKRRTKWIDRRLRKTTHLGESSALVANDIAANIPDSDDGRLTVVIEVSGGHVWDVFSNRPAHVTVILVDHDESEDEPGKSARLLEVCPLSVIGKESKALMFDAGLSLNQPRHDSVQIRIEGQKQKPDAKITHQAFFFLYRWMCRCRSYSAPVMGVLQSMQRTGKRGSIC